MTRHTFTQRSRRQALGSRRGRTLGRHLGGLIALAALSFSSARLCEAQVIWSIWASVSEGQSTPGATVTAVPWGDRIALFVADHGGGIFTAAGDPQRGFGPWASVSEGRSTPGATVTAVPWGDRFALFVADPGGGIFTAAGDPQRGFGPWASVSEGRSTPGATVTAVPWRDGFALFVADPGGGIFTAAGDPQRGFGPWASVSEGKSRPGATVTALPWRDRFALDRLALFVADPGGGIFTAAGDPQRGFGPWASVSQGRSTPGATVTAVGWRDRFALFVADPGGGILYTTGTPDAGWEPWASVSDGRTKPGATVTAVPWTDRLALFVADPSGGIFADGSLKAMDVVWSNEPPPVDHNGFPRNPLWAQQTLSQPPNPCDFCPCGKLRFDEENWNNKNSEHDHPNCTSQSIHNNSGFATFCANVGHLNWFPVEYEGTVTWNGASGDYVGFDDDDSFTLHRKDQALEAARPGHEGLHIEFSRTETVDHWGDTNTWWEDFDKKVGGRAANDDAARGLIDGNEAVVIGMLGIDFWHDPHSELHPVYAMFVRLPESPEQDHWAFFVRNWGDEGNCGPSQEELPLPQNALRIFLKHPGATRFELVRDNVRPYGDDSECDQQSWTQQPFEDGVLLTFSLRAPAKHCGFVGDLTINWGGGSLRAAAPEKRRPAAAALEEDVGDSVLRSKTDKLDPSAQELLSTQLKSLTPHRTWPRKPGTMNTSPPPPRVKPRTALPNYDGVFKAVADPAAEARRARELKLLLSFLKAHGIE